MAEWTIQGETGKTLNASVRAFSSLDPTSAKVIFRSLEVDVFSFALEVDDFTVTTNIPELEQSVTLFRDGARFFSGTVTNVRASVRGNSQVIQIDVSGPWWLAEHTTLQFGATDGTGQTSVRPTANWSTGTNLKTAIEGIIDRAIDYGVNWQRGTVSSYFAIPAITLNQMSVAQALAETVRLVPDAMTWIDYSTTPPTINVTRRGSATTRSLALGTDDIVSYEVNPVLQLKVDQVVIPYVTRAANGRTMWQQQSSGTAAAGKSGITVVSGPELDTFLPKDGYDSVQVRTISTGATSGAFIDLVNSSNDEIIRLRQNYGSQWYGGSVVGTNGYQAQFAVGGGETVPYHGSPPSSSATPVLFPPGVRTFRDENGATVSGHVFYPNFLLPDWFIKQYGVKKITVTYCIYVILDWKVGQHSPNIPGLMEFASDAAYLFNYFNIFGSTYGKRSIYWKTIKADSYLSSQAFPSLTTVYKAGDYSFVAPPANFAANLLAAQNWIPYEGRIEIVADEVGTTRYRGCKVNATGSVAAHATMGALVESEELDIMSGVTTISLGAPPRIDYRTFMDKIRHTPQNNIVYS